MTKSRRPAPLLAIILVLSALQVTAGCKRTALDRSQEPIRLSLAENITPVSAPVTLARLKGFFAEEGLDCDMSRFSSGRLALDALLGGKADLATVAETPIALAAMQGQRIRVLCTFTSSKKNTKILARADRDITKVADLVGKKVAVTFGTNGAYFLDLALRTHGIDTRSVIQMNLNPPDMPAALARGDVDAICTWEPNVRNARKLLADAVVLDTSEVPYTQTFNIVANENWATRNIETSQAFLAALLRSEQFILDSRREAIALVAKENSMTEDDLAAIWPDYDFRVTLNRDLTEALVKEAEWAARTGIAPSDSHLPPVDQLLFVQPLRFLKPIVVESPQR